MTNTTRSAFIVPEREYATEADHEERWPIPYAAMFIVTSSAVCWAIILGGLGWVFG